MIKKVPTEGPWSRWSWLAWRMATPGMPTVGCRNSARCPTVVNRGVSCCTPVLTRALCTARPPTPGQISGRDGSGFVLAEKGRRWSSRPATLGPGGRGVFEFHFRCPAEWGWADVSQSDCEAAARSVRPAGISVDSEVEVGSWTDRPAGCSVESGGVEAEGGWAGFYNTGPHPVACDPDLAREAETIVCMEMYTPICRGEVSPVRLCEQRETPTPWHRPRSPPHTLFGPP